jgi:hypothetical protein
MDTSKLELALAALLGQARHIAGAARAIGLDTIGQETGQPIADALGKIEDAPMLSSEVGVAINSITGRVDDALEPHFLGIERRFDGCIDSDEGAVGDVIEVAIYAAEARDLLALRRDLEIFSQDRQRVIHNVRAWRELEAALSQQASG